MIMTARLASLWPPDRLPSLRRVVVAVSLAPRRAAGLLDPREFWRFRAWRAYSRLRHGPVRPVTVYDRRSITVRTDDFRAYRISRMGGTQPEKVALWGRLLSLRPDVAVDVGANYGEFAGAAPIEGPPVVAVEANPDLVACLNETFRGTGIRVVHAAAADHEGDISFFYNRRSSGAGSAHANVVQTEREQAGRGGRVRGARVPARRLDRLLPEVLGRMPRSVVMKIDVEGAEDSVLSGASGVLEQADWWAALVEFNPAALRTAGKDPDALWRILRAHPGRLVGTGEGLLPDASDILPERPSSRDVDVLVAKLPGHALGAVL